MRASKIKYKNKSSSPLETVKFSTKCCLAGRDLRHTTHLLEGSQQHWVTASPTGCLLTCNTTPRPRRDTRVTDVPTGFPLIHCYYVEHPALSKPGWLPGWRSKAHSAGPRQTDPYGYTWRSGDWRTNRPLSRDLGSTSANFLSLGLYRQLITNTQVIVSLFSWPTDTDIFLHLPEQ